MPSPFRPSPTGRMLPAILPEAHLPSSITSRPTSRRIPVQAIYSIACCIALLIAALVILPAGSLSAQTAVADITVDYESVVRASVPGPGQAFGQSITIDGNTLVVGAPYYVPPGSTDTINATGAAYVYVRSGTTWTQQALLRSSDSAIGDQFGGSVALQGDTLFVGARVPNAVYVFTRTGTTWTQRARLSGAYGGEFGHSLAVYGNMLAVGASCDSHAVDGQYLSGSLHCSGAVYLFTGSGATWTQQARLKASNAGAMDWFGSSVALSDTWLLVGAPGEDGVNNTTTNAGAAYLFQRTQDTWTEYAYLKASNTGAWHGYGGAVALDDTGTAVIGAPIEYSAGEPSDTSAPGAGAVYIYTLMGGTTWQETGYLKSSHPEYNDQFGTALALSGEWLLVGVPNEDGNGSGPDDNSLESSGAAFLFRRSGQTWTRAVYIKARTPGSGYGFGGATAISGSTLAIGAPGDGANYSGAVYLYTPNTAEGTLAFTTEASSVTEGQSPAIEVRLTVTGVGKLPSPITATLAYSGSAVATTDYSGPTTVTFTNAGGFPAGTYTSGVSLSTVDDITDEPDKTLTLTLTNITRAVAGTPSTHTVSLLDNDYAPVVVTAPTGTINADYGNPVYRWTHVGAPGYELHVSRVLAQLSRPPYAMTTTAFSLTHLAAATYCNETECAIQPASFSAGQAEEAVALNQEATRLPGNALYWVYVRPTGGRWSSVYPFTLNAAAPAVPTLGTPTNTHMLRPTFNFTLEGSAANSTWLRVYIAPTINTWERRMTLCGGVNGTTCSYTPSVNLTNNTAYTFWLSGYGPGGYAVGGTDGWVSQPFTVQVPVPPALTAPTGTITSVYGDPTYTWNVVEHATLYELAVARPNGSTLFYLPNIDAATYCGGGTCVVQPITLLGETARLTENGTYKAYLRAAGGSWSAAYPFTLSAPAPTPPTLGTPTNTHTLRPTFNFTLEGDAANSTLLEVYIEYAASGTFTRAQLCGSITGTTCSYTPSANLATGRTFWLRGRGPGGTSGWISQAFTVQTPPPPALTAPTGTISDGYGNPTYTWNAVEHATIYEMAVSNPDGSTLFYLPNIDAATYCGGGTCVVQPITLLGETARLPANGTYKVYLRAAGGTWSAPYPFTLSAAAPGLPVLGTPINTNTLRPTVPFTLDGSAANSTWLRVSLHPVVSTWFPRTQLCGSATSTTCSFTPSVDLVNGTTYTLWVHNYGPGGHATGGTEGWVGASFTVNTAADLLPAEITGLSAEFADGSVTVRWTHAAEATNYALWLGTPGGGQTFAALTLAADTLGCTAAGETCTFSAALEAVGLVPGAQVSIGVQSIGTAGTRVTGGTYGNGYVVVGPLAVP